MDEPRRRDSAEYLRILRMDSVSYQIIPTEPRRDPDSTRTSEGSCRVSNARLLTTQGFRETTYLARWQDPRVAEGCHLRSSQRNREIEACPSADCCELFDALRIELAVEPGTSYLSWGE